MSEWTVDTLKEHVDALRAADQRALQIKETADEKALNLSAEVQRYKDAKANELREQIEAERGRYLTVESYQQGHRELEKTVGALSETVTALVTERAAAIRDLGHRITLGLGIATLVISLIVAWANGVFG
jgi:vacuolar-type H+-ATPase subunit E/Vma4